ncbi:MAG TPA: Mut7-C RNAse domain-containing protein [Candidatus Bathyarchaeia archaeon]|nr:Mut7-C RNAse domain-containing protein [Candidatus Bathyarchaeia archaeon]
MNFIIDSMLGKLTRWLRMMGHDAKYSTTLEDAELLVIAKNEPRVLLQET